MTVESPSSWKERLFQGAVIPAHPLALNARRKLDERRQRALSRYYCDAGAGGLAVGVHTTQFEIRDPEVGLLQPVLELAREEMDRADAAASGPPLIRIAGVVGRTEQAVREAELAAGLGYHAALVSLSAFPGADDPAMLEHLRAVAAVIPVFGFYLQPSVGGRLLSYEFWRQAFEIDKVIAVKTAPFNRYQTLDVARALADSGRAGQVALYTGNDDNIVLDLLTTYRFSETDGVEVPFRGGLLGQWAVWTHKAVEMFEDLKSLRHLGQPVGETWLTRAQQLTDANSAIFDVANQFRGCIAGIHEILRRQGLLEGIWCLNPGEGLSTGQADALTRVCKAYPWLVDDAFVQEHRHRWLSA